MFVKCAPIYQRSFQQIDIAAVVGFHAPKVQGVRAQLKEGKLLACVLEVERLAGNGSCVVEKSEEAGGGQHRVY